MNEQQAVMHAHYQRMLGGLVDHAECDVLLARTANDQTALAKAQARLATLQAALEIYAAAHKLAYQVRPWPRPVGDS